MNDFEADVYESLSAKGIVLKPQVGCSKFRIDLAAAHPRHPGKFVLAIECDGATYHSSYTARDRDRLRQQQLQNLGWTFYRIWSTDWFMRKHEEVERAVQAFNTAVAASDAPRANHVLYPQPDGSEQQFVTRSEANLGVGSRRSPIPTHSSIGDYSFEELIRLAEWVQTDGKLRTHDEIADGMFAALPFARRGSKIEAALKERNRTMGTSTTELRLFDCRVEVPMIDLFLKVDEISTEDQAVIWSINAALQRNKENSDRNKENSDRRKWHLAIVAFSKVPLPASVTKPCHQTFCPSVTKPFVTKPLSPNLCHQTFVTKPFVTKPLSVSDKPPRPIDGLWSVKKYSGEMKISQATALIRTPLIEWVRPQGNAGQTAGECRTDGSDPNATVSDRVTPARFPLVPVLSFSPGLFESKITRQTGLALLSSGS